MAENNHIPTMPQTSENNHIPTMPQTSENEHIPTMPQAGASEHIPTMPQASASEHIPTMPQAGASEHIPTVPQTTVDGKGHVATMPQATAAENGHVSTVPQTGAASSATSNSRLLYSEVNFTDDAGKQFVIMGSAPVSTDTGEAQIYRCKNEDGTGDYVAKILVTLRPDSSPKKLKTRKRVIEFLDKYSNSSEYHILPLIGHGIVDINGGQYFVDIYPYCSGGDLGSKVGEFSLAQLVSDVIPAVNEAIHIFHQERLVHRDLKPDNLFYYNDEIVIGDFGITCELNTDDYAVDTEKIGTLGYFAPELMSEAAIVASDYYAFGQTIWSLYHGEMMYRETIRSHGGFFSPEARNTVSDLMRKNELPGLDEIDRKDEFFEVLIRGLLQYDPNTRFGYKDVQRWLKGDKSLYLRVKTLRGDEIFERTITVNGRECIDNGQVATQLSSSWVQSVDLLYGETLYQQYKFTLCRDEDAQVIKDIYEGVKSLNLANPNDLGVYQDIGLSRVIMNLSENKLLSWRGRTYTTPVEISDAMERVHSAGSNKEDFYVFILSGLVQEWLERVGVTDSKALAEVERLQQLARSSRMGVTVAYYWMHYMFIANRDDAEYRDCKSIDDIAKMLLSSPAALYQVEDDLCCVENPQILGFLCSLGYDEAVAAFLTDAKIDYKRHYEMLFDLFENNIKKPEILDLVHKSYCEFGPMAHLVWWKNNLSIYKFVGLSAKTIEQNVMAVAINPSDDISKQRGELSKLEQSYSDFRKYFRVNYLLGLAGIRRLAGKDYIYSGKLSGLVAYHFLNQDAPIGYKYSLKI